MDLILWDNFRTLKKEVKELKKETEEIKKHMKYIPHGEQLLEDLPSEQSEIIRCKDCKFRKIEFGWNGKRYKMCANTDYPTDDDAYCSYGERREDGEVL